MSNVEGSWNFVYIMNSSSPIPWDYSNNASTVLIKFRFTIVYFDNHMYYRNPNIGLATKARACKVAGQKGSLGVKPKSEGKCEGMNPHTPKGTSTLGVGILVDSQIFRK
jgi:hypothetical protein